ncbi:MAG: DUF5320 domain-containing protein [Bacteroidales bacterium]|nr:DUF5320 domain-containing protein [Bacteroidales bacterium]
MPGFDRTGPEGKGSRTGRGLGKCNPDNKITDEKKDTDEFRRGLGRRAGRGYGVGNGNRPGRRLRRFNS